MPLLSRMHLYDAMNSYLLTQEHRLQSLETKIWQLEKKLDRLESLKPQEESGSKSNKIDKK
jgi:hypothetical protein